MCDFDWFSKIQLHMYKQAKCKVTALKSCVYYTYVHMAMWLATQMQLHVCYDTSSTIIS